MSCSSPISVRPAVPLLVNRCPGSTTSTSSSSYSGRLSISGWRIARVRPSCTSSLRVSSRIASECPVLTEIETLGCAAANLSNNPGNAYVPTPGEAPILSRPPEAPLSSSNRRLPSSKLPASLREPHPTARAHEERIPKLLLQCLEARRQRRLREIHLLSSPAQVPKPRHGQKAFQLSEEHAVSLRSSASQPVPFGDSQHAAASPPLSAFQPVSSCLLLTC